RAGPPRLAPLPVAEPRQRLPAHPAADLAHPPVLTPPRPVPLIPGPAGPCPAAPLPDWPLPGWPLPSTERTSCRLRDLNPPYAFRPRHRQEVCSPGGRSWQLASAPGPGSWPRRLLLQLTPAGGEVARGAYGAVPGTVGGMSPAHPTHVRASDDDPDDDQLVAELTALLAEVDRFTELAERMALLSDARR